MKDYTYIVEIKQTVTADNEDEAQDKLYQVLKDMDVIDAECVEEGETY